MFGNNDDSRVKELRQCLEKRDEEIKQLQSEFATQKREYESKEKILRNELQMEISKAVETEKQNTAKVQQENAVLLKEVEILKKAFENMGFDVKDMKEILNKLVDGVVAKNEIKLVK